MGFLGLDSEFSNLETARVVVLPVPFERTSTFGVGSAAGPDAIIKASHEVELFDVVLSKESFKACHGIATLEPVTAFSGAKVCQILDQAVADQLERGRFVVTLGGEHSSIVGAVRAHSRYFPDLTVIQFDAHSDLRESYQDNKWNHACAMARILEFQDDVIQVGIRSQAREERDQSEELDLPVFYAHEVHESDRSGGDWIGSVISKCNKNVYITFDCDAFDPAVIPATGTPEPGGLNWYQLDRFIDRLTAVRNLVGFDVSELAPIHGLHHPQFTMAKLIYRWIGYVF